MRRTSMRTMVGIGVAAAFALALPGAASAAITAETTGGTLVINGDSSPNMVAVDWDEYLNEVVVSDPVAPFEPMTPGPGCVPTVNVGHQNTPELHCSPAELHAVTISVGEGNDDVSVAVSRSDEIRLGDLFPFRVLVVGGEGDDDLQTGGWHGRAFGEEGDDSLYGRIGDTYLSGGSGNDDLIDIDGGNDRLDGGSQGDRLDSFSGRDVLIGGAGRDVMRAGKGRDRILAIDATRDKRVRCGPGGGDVASVDAVDPAAGLCEKVLRIP
jgi:Ca2+-binding RTX toxin-like protein